MDLSQWSPQVLTGAVALMVSEMVEDYPVLYNLYWGNGLSMAQKKHKGVNIGIDIVEGSQALMRALSVYDPRVIGRGESESTLTATMPRFDEGLPVLLGDVLSTREPGVPSRDMTNIDTEVRRKLRVLIGKFLNTLEFMAARSLFGSIVMPDANDTMVEVANWSLPDGHKVTRLTDDRRWGKPASTPRADIDSAKVLIRRAVHSDPPMWYGFASSDVLNAAASDDNLRGDAEILSDEQLSAKLRLDKIVSYDKEYYDEDAKEWKRVIDKNEIVVVGKQMDFFCLHHLDIYGLILMAQMVADIDYDMPSEILGGLAISEVKLKDSPRCLMVSLEGAVLPACQAPGCTAILTPIGAK